MSCFFRWNKWKWIAVILSWCTKAVTTKFYNKPNVRNLHHLLIYFFKYILQQKAGYWPVSVISLVSKIVLVTVSVLWLFIPRLLDYSRLGALDSFSFSFVLLVFHRCVFLTHSEELVMHEFCTNDCLLHMYERLYILDYSLYVLLYFIYSFVQNKWHK